MWTKKCLSISHFLLLCTLHNFDKKVWTGGPVMEILKKIVSTSWIFLFASVDMWTKRCLSFSCFLSVMYSSQFWQKSVDRWTSNENYEKSLNLIYLLFESVDLWTSSYLSILSLLSTLYPSKFWQESVDRWTRNEKFWKKGSTWYVL